MLIFCWLSLFNQILNKIFLSFFHTKCYFQILLFIEISKRLLNCWKDKLTCNFLKWYFIFICILWMDLPQMLRPKTQNFKCSEKLSAKGLCDLKWIDYKFKIRMLKVHTDIEIGQTKEEIKCPFCVAIRGDIY